ncbi:MAG: glycoside-pentoside-hexuronide (GPH):cation symporter [Pseudomonadota bacterium]|nr:glycoside-pentoside-hexuronide (GPH):cation symporter [Pseudomonadota bacterium]
MDRQKLQRLAGYGVGDFGLNIYWHSLSLILVFWYAEVVGLDPTLAGWIYALGLLWDAISDPLIATIAASNRSRYGVYRPFILFGSVGLGASFCLLFWAPPLEGWFLFAALLGSAMIFRTSYTIVAVPYSALSARLTFSSVERAELSGVRMFFAFCGMLCVTTFFFPMSRYFGAGGTYTSDGFFLTAMLGAGIATIALCACFFLTKEKPPLGGDDLPQGWDLRSFKSAFTQNDSLRLLLLLLLLNAAAGSSISIPLAFYVEANSNAFADKEFVLSGYAFATLAGVPFWTLVTRSIGKKKCWYLGTAVTAVAGVSLALSGPILVGGIPVQLLAFGFAGSAFAIIIWALIPDTVEYGQYRYGERDEGAVFGASLLVQKASGALTGLGVGYLLSGIGYEPERDVQTAQTALALGQFMAIVPAVLLVAASITLFLMPLTRDLHARIVDELSR